MTAPETPKNEPSIHNMWDEMFDRVLTKAGLPKAVQVNETGYSVTISFKLPKPTTTLNPLKETK